MKHAERLRNLVDLAANREDFKPADGRPAKIGSREALPSELVSHKSNLFFTGSVLGMLAISQVIEDKAACFNDGVVDSRLRNSFSLHTTLQKLSRLAPQEERYIRILKQGQPVYTYGIADIKMAQLAPNHHIIEFETENNKIVLDRNTPNMSQFWIVALYSPDFVSMAVVARELPLTVAQKFQRSVKASQVSRTVKMPERCFEGFWTYDQTIIGEIVSVLTDYAKLRSRS
jgi:hypothetical protein